MSWPKTFGGTGSSPRERQANLAREGLRFEVVIRPDAGQPPGSLAILKSVALVDTGATQVCIDIRKARELNLRENGQCTLSVVPNKVEAFRFMGMLEVPELEYAEPVEFVAPKLGTMAYDVLLGRSFLQHFIMNYDGLGGIVLIDRGPPQVHHDHDYDG